MKNLWIAAVLLMVSSSLMAIKPTLNLENPPVYVAADITIEVEGQPITLRAGTPIAVEIVQNMATNNMSVGQSIPVRVKSNIIVDKTTLISAGTMGTATITAIKKPKGWGKAGKVEIQVSNVPAVDNQSVSLSGLPISLEGKNKKGLAIGLAIGLGLLTIVGAAVGFAIKGKPAEIKTGMTMSGSVVSDMNIESN